MIRFSTIAFVVAVLLSSAQIKDPQPRDSGEELADALVKWDADCNPKGCILQTDVLRGESGNPPDAKDPREYIGIYVPIERATRQPAYFAFHVDPRAEQNNGIFITFSMTTRDGDSWKLNLDPEGPARLMFDSCDEQSCVVRVPCGVVEEGEERHRMNLLDKFLDSNHLLILYLKDGKAYRTMVILSSFKKTYQHLLTNELSSNSK